MSESARDATDPLEPPVTVSIIADGPVAAAIIVVSFASLYFFNARGLSNLYGDGVAHMEGARRIFDSLTPGYPEIGSVWLPLYHLVAAPLALNDFLWRTGLAGGLVSTAAFAGAVWFLYRLAVEINRNRAAGVLGVAVLLLSPNLLYLASTPLTEPLAIFLAVLVVYGLFRYQENGGLAALTSAAVAAFVGTLTRYDEWYVLPFAALFVLVARHQPWRARFRHAMLFSVIAGAGPMLWFLHNAYRFGNPLEFYNGPFSAQAIYAHQLATTAFPYPTDGKVLLAGRYYLEDLKVAMGVWPVVLAAFGLVAWLGNRPETRRGTVALLFLVPLPFYINAMAYAAVPLYVPTLFPNTYYNLRYGLEMMPAIALLSAFLLPGRLPQRLRNVLLGFFLLILTGQAISLCWRGAGELVVVKEGILNTPCRAKRQQAIIRFLRSRYDGQRVLMAVGKWPCVMPEVGIYYRNTLTEANREYWQRLRSQPEEWVEWIIRGDGDAVDELMRAYPQAFTKFELLEKDYYPGEGGVEIYRRRSP